MAPHLNPRHLMVPPQKRSSDESKKELAASAARHAQFVRDFVAQGRDPRSLPRIKIPSYNPGPSSLAEAVRAADTIVVGKVQSTSFAPDLSDPRIPRPPLATSTVVVEQVLRGTAGPVLSVVQVGGPVPQTSGGPALIHINTDELLLPGDTVLLFLRYDPQRKTFRTLIAAGVYFIEAGRAAPEQSNQFGRTLAGKTRADLITTIAAEIRRSS